MLKSEWKCVRELRMLLSLARLGPGGYDDYMSRVTTEASRRDFESTFHDKRAFKLFMQSLASVKQSRRRSYYGRNNRNNPMSNSGGRNRRRGNRGGNGRNRNASSSYRPLQFRNSRSDRGAGRSRSSRSSGASRSSAPKRNNKRRRV